MNPCEFFEQQLNIILFDFGLLKESGGWGGWWNLAEVTGSYGVRKPLLFTPPLLSGWQNPTAVCDRDWLNPTTVCDRDWLNPQLCVTGTG